jgi:hypothetical protein
VLIKAPTLAQADAQKSRKFGLSSKFILGLLLADCQVLGRLILKLTLNFLGHFGHQGSDKNIFGTCLGGRHVRRCSLAHTGGIWRAGLGTVPASFVAKRIVATFLNQEVAHGDTIQYGLIHNCGEKKCSLKKKKVKSDACHCQDLPR